MPKYTIRFYKVLTCLAEIDAENPDTACVEFVKRINEGKMDIIAEAVAPDCTIDSVSLDQCAEIYSEGDEEFYEEFNIW